MLDEMMRGLGKDLIDLFVSEDSVITRKATTYDGPTDVETELDPVTEPVKTSPPFPFDSYRVDGKTVLVDDVRVLVSALVLDELGFSLETIQGQETEFFLTLMDVDYSIVGINRYASGDQVALYELQLRG